MCGRTDKMGESSFAFKSILFALTVSLMLPIMINLFAPTVMPEVNGDESLQGYYEFTNSRPTSEAVWCLNGIYTPYGVNANGQPNTQSWGYTDDGWLYGARIVNYSPSQYSSTMQSYSVYRDDQGFYRYSNSTAFGDHQKDDLYSDVTMDANQKSQIFFTTQGKHSQDSYFYYDFSGYRYSFVPQATHYTTNQDGDRISVQASTTSLSLIWYQYYIENQSGISGQLIVSGNDFSVAYLTQSEIIRAFNSTTSTAKFQMLFMGLPINIYVKINPTFLSEGYSIEDCYNNGWWSLMVTSNTADSNAYTQSDYGMNAGNILQTLVDLLTFNYSNYGMSDAWGLLCSFVVIVPFYATLIALMIGTDAYKMVIILGLVAVIQTVATAISNWGWPL